MKSAIRSATMIASCLIIALFLPFPGFSQGIIIDHTCTDLSRIPSAWLEQAKQLKLHYAHTSHGSQVTTGISNLESIDSYYSVAIRVSSSEGLPPVEDPPAFRIYDGNPPETYISPDDYWEGSNAWARTTAVAATGNYDFSMWSWCGQVSDASESYINEYLNTMDRFESWYTGMRFIYMTGHLDGSGSTGNLHQRNEQIRDYCRTNNKILFDFADIERYDPDGVDYLDLGANDDCDYSGGNWANEWCAANPGSILCEYCSCAHSQPLNCNQKARALWWMMARLAGWNGQTGAPTPTPTPQSVSYFASGDYDGDGTSDPVIFRPSNGLWAARGITRLYFGGDSDLPVPGDYAGSGTMDVGIFRPESGLWAIRGLTRLYFGEIGDLPIPADYDGDGLCDIGLFREEYGLWLLKGLSRVYFGGSGDIPVPGDYSGSGIARIGIFRPSSGLWALRGVSRIYFMVSGAGPVPGDYDGNGSCNLGLFRPAGGLWAIRGITTCYFGEDQDQPVPVDFNGDGTDDIGIFRGRSGLWSVQGITRVYYGDSDDIPVTR